MNIKVLRDGCLCLLGKDEKILVNPGKEVLDDKKYRSRIVLFTREELDFLGLSFEGVVIRGSGEYEVGGVEISGVDGNGGGVAYLIGLDEVMMAVVDGAGSPLDKKLVDKVKGVDVMLVMARRGEKVDSKAVLAVAKKWGVNYLVPIGFESDDLEVLLDSVDREDLQTVASLKVEKDGLPDGMEVVLLSND